MFRMSEAIPLLSLHFTTLDKDSLTVYLQVTALKGHYDVIISPNKQHGAKKLRPPFFCDVTVPHWVMSAQAFETKQCS
jgi:hypothetical protein